MGKLQLTKQERHEIYKKAKQMLLSGRGEFLCQVLYLSMRELMYHQNFIKNCRFNYSIALSLSPEIQKLKPASIIDPEDAWWDSKVADLLGFKMRIWMIDTAIIQTKEINPEKVINPIKIYNNGTDKEEN